MTVYVFTLAVKARCTGINSWYMADTFRQQQLLQKLYVYSGPCNLRPPIQPAKYGLKLKMVLK